MSSLQTGFHLLTLLFPFDTIAYKELYKSKNLILYFLTFPENINMFLFRTLLHLST